MDGELQVQDYLLGSAVSDYNAYERAKRRLRDIFSGPLKGGSSQRSLIDCGDINTQPEYEWEFLSYHPENGKTLSQEAELFINSLGDELARNREVSDSEDPDYFGITNSALSRLFRIDHLVQIPNVSDGLVIEDEVVRLLKRLPEDINWSRCQNLYEDNIPPRQDFDDNTLLLAAQITILEYTGRSVSDRFLNRLKRYPDMLSRALAYSHKLGLSHPYSMEILFCQTFLATAWQRFGNLILYMLAGRLCGDRWSPELFEVMATDSSPSSKFKLLTSEMEIDHFANSYLCPRAYQVIKSSVAGLYLDVRLYDKLLAYHIENLRVESMRMARTEESDLAIFGLYDHLSCTEEVCRNHEKQSELEHDPILKKAYNDATNGSQHDESRPSHLRCGFPNSRLLGDMESFAAAKSITDSDKDIARVVDISRTGNMLKYAPFQEDTVVISHVWSNGQGGNPDRQGINPCLHDRYELIANRLGCRYYYIDAACIPEQPDLRSEAIRTLNHVFLNAKAVIIIENLVRTIDKSNYELLLTALAFGDWNTRSWTFFEGTMGSGRLYLLCKGNEVLPLQELFRSVHKSSNINLSIPMIALQHVFESARSGYVGEWGRDSLDQDGHVLERSGAALSFRRASRPGDDKLIWGLLVKGKPPRDGIWKELPDYLLVHSSFIVSSMTRLVFPDIPTKDMGLSRFYRLGWCPSAPSASWNSSDGAGSRLAVVLPDKTLLSSWYLHDVTQIDAENLAELVDRTPSRYVSNTPFAEGSQTPDRLQASWLAKAQDLSIFGNTHPSKNLALIHARDRFGMGFFGKGSIIVEKMETYEGIDLQQLLQDKEGKKAFDKSDLSLDIDASSQGQNTYRIVGFVPYNFFERDLDGFVEATIRLL